MIIFRFDFQIKQKEGEVNKYGSDIESDEEKEPELPDMGKEEQEALQTYQKILVSKIYPHIRALSKTLTQIIILIMTFSKKES